MPPDDPDEFVAHVERRRAEIDARIEQLGDRRRAIGERAGRGSPAQEAAEALRAARSAYEHAVAAHRRAADRYDRAAAAHERAARLLTRHGDLPRAEHHRQAAARMRRAAQAGQV